jgi:hypothetical protein
MSISVIINTSNPDDDDRDGHRNVGKQRTPNTADSPRRLYQKHLFSHFGTFSPGTPFFA